VNLAQPDASFRIVVAVAVACAALFARADTDEAWLRRAALPAGTRPLLAIVLDRSEATLQMLPARESYDSTRDYGAAVPVSSRCNSTKVYFRRGPGPAPDCGRQAGFDLAPPRSDSGLQCIGARAALSSYGFYIASRAAQWRASAEGGYWGTLREDRAEAVECRADRGRHGTTPGTWFASNGTGTPWTNSEDREIDWDRPPFADAFIFYAGNYLNFLQVAAPTAEHTIADLTAGLLAKALDATDDLDVALMRVDDDGGGGYVARAPASNHVVSADLRALATTTPEGPAPLAETLVETAVWLQGGIPQFGLDTRADPAAREAGNAYHSPFEHACRPVSVAVLSAGVATADEQASVAAGSLAHFVEETGGCDGDCLATLGSWIGAADLRDDVAGRQSSPASWIVPLPTALASNGDVASPADPLGYANLVAQAFQRDAAVAAGPQLSAAALTATHGRVDDDAGVILGLTAPRNRARWPGNLFRYRLHAPIGPLEPPLVVDRAGEPAIDPTSGLPLPGSRNLWSEVPDSDLLAGGANGRLPSPDARGLYTDIASARILDPANRLVPGNARINRAMVGLGPGDPESPDDMLAWPAAQSTLGDPGLHAPVVVEYPDAGRVIAFADTQDGLLHALDASSGIELWAWMPQGFLPRIPELSRDAETTAPTHGLDGSLVVHRHDTDGDGRISASSGEHLWLLFGSGRGGNRYYALDIASPLDPRLVWSFTLPDAVVESRADPVVTRLAIAGSGQSAGDWVVLVAGGYDPRFDAQGATGGGHGAVLHVVDAASGRELWSAGNSGTAYTLAGLSSLASAPRALDLDGDGYLDRAYLLDVAGSLWRLDFANVRPASELATGHRLAQLGGGTQRFFATPDAALVRQGAEPRLAISAGSGWLTRPRDETIGDRVYVVFDRPDSAAPREVTASDLYDATDNPGGMPPGSAGWYVRLAAHGAGEKVVGPTVTFDHALRFQTYQPLAADDSTPCGPPRAATRRYALDVRTALPLEFAVESEEDDDIENEAAGLPVELKFGFPGRWEEACDGCKPRPFGFVGGETFDPGYSGGPVRTSWRKLVPPPASP